MANSVSNGATVALSLYGASNAASQGPPLRRQLGFLVSQNILCESVAHHIQGLGIVGVGSFAFHASLLYSAQLADELPMIYSSSWSCFALFDTEFKFNEPWSRRSSRLMWSFITFDAIFTL